MGSEFRIGPVLNGKIEFYLTGSDSSVNKMVTGCLKMAKVGIFEFKTKCGI